MKKHMIKLAAGILLCSLIGCSAAKSNMEQETDEALVVYCPHPINFINPIVSEFENRTGIPVKVQTGGTGELLLMAEEGKEPRCDVLWGGSLSTTLPKKDLFSGYISVNEDMVQEEYKNKEGNLTRFTDIPSVLMINTNLTGVLSVKGYMDLLNPMLKGRIAMCDPALSSSAYEHLINMLYACGDKDPEQGWDYVEAFCKNLDGKLLKSSSQVYQGVAEGRFAVGLTFEEGAAHYVSGGDPVKLVYMEEGVVFTPDLVCIMKESVHEEEARAFVDFVTGKDAQTMITAGLNRRSVREDVRQPEGLPDKRDISVIYCDEELGNARKKQWIGHFEDLYRNVAPGAFLESISEAEDSESETGAGFILVLIYGRMKSSREQNRFTAMELERILRGYEEQLAGFSKDSAAYTGKMAPTGRIIYFEDFYRNSDELGCSADFYILDGEKKPIMFSSQGMPQYLTIPSDVKWGIFSAMEGKNGGTAFRLMDSYKTGNKDLAMGQIVKDENGEKLGYAVITINSGQFQNVLDHSEAQTIVTDRFGWEYLSNSYNFLDGSNRILDVMGTAGNGDLDTSIRIESNNEFAILADAYNEMILRLKKQMENNRRMAELVAVSQNRQLESQFNPHFLYNTLENIRYMCRIEPEIASKMIFALSQLLRYSLDSTKAEVPLNEDMEHLESYLTILKYRFNRRFSYQIDIEPEVRSCLIPKLIMQPMIENAVKYGFGDQQTLRVELTAYLYQDKLTMICRDDGVEIRSTEGHGTMLVVTVPAHREETEC